jgi:hypothetical protein
MRKMQKGKNHGPRGSNGRILGWRLIQTPYNSTRDPSRFRVRVMRAIRS